jgi:glyoxylase-like metal-dependent hydrolase (beta-lactamase superfamily II)
MVVAVPYALGLHELGPGTWAWLWPPGSWGAANGGVIVSGDQAVLVDTPWTLDRTRQLLGWIQRQVPGVKVSTVVNSHPNGDHCWGNQLLPDAEIVASAATAHGMHDEIGPAAMTAMRADTPPDSPLGRYMRRFFAGYDWTGITLVPATRTFTGATTVTVGDRVVELIQVGPAHTDGDVIVHVPDASVVYTGDILFAGDHPVMWSGPIDGWIAACDTIATTGARTVVPGHGPVTDQAGVAAMRGYLVQVAELATAAFNRGVGWQEAAAQIAAAGPAGWRHAERLAVTVGVIYRHLGHPDPPTRPAMIDAMARQYWQLHSGGDPRPRFDEATEGAAAAA